MKPNIRGISVSLVLACLFAVAAHPSAAWAKAPQAEKIGEAKPKPKPKPTPPPGAKPGSESLLPAGKRKPAPKDTRLDERNSLSHYSSRPNGSIRQPPVSDQQHRNEKTQGKHEVAHGESREHEPEAHDACDVLYSAQGPRAVEKCKEDRKARESKSRK